jgi:hypothetical protein
MPMSQLTDTKEHVVRIWMTLRAWSVPQDGFRRYFYDIWQPLTVLVLAACFTGSFFAVKNPYPSTEDLFYCNADGNVQMLDAGDYQPFWDPDLFFTINLPTADNLTFTEAKLIDAVWDLGVGRGGQIIAAVITYRVLRRSLTLVMESCTVSIPTVTSVCCQQINVWSSWHLLRDIFSQTSSRQFAGKRLSLNGRRRLLMQLFACMYVLVFPTLTSVMTGYRTGFTGLFDYANGTMSEVKPIDQVGYPRMILSDGRRIGLANSTSYLPRQMPNPSIFSLDDFLLSSESFEEPAGVLADCKYDSHLVSTATDASDLCLPDYFTCLAVMEIAQLEQKYTDLSGPYEKPFTFACAFHDCSCSISETSFGRTMGNYSMKQLSANTTSNITIRGTRISLPAPPLNISFAFHYADPRIAAINATSASEFWWGVSYWFSSHVYDYQGNMSSYDKFFNGSIYTEEFIKRTGICIASEAYSWGFSSLLLLTFCIYTLLFATTLITLQTEVYRHSRLDRDHQSHSIYADILAIAEALKSIPEYNLLELLRSPKEIDEKIGGRKHGIRFDMRGLPLARSDEKWALKEEKLRDELASAASRTQEETELQRLELVQQGPGLEGDGLIRISRASHEPASEDSNRDRTMSGAI